jgi:hypothetical protein
MPDIIAFYESEEGKKIFEEWKKSRTRSNDVYDEVGDNKINTTK